MGYVFLASLRDAEEVGGPCPAQLSAYKEVALNYRPFIGLVASILLLNVAACGNTAIFAQSVPSLESPSCGQKNSGGNKNSCGQKKFASPGAAEFLSGATKIEGLFPWYRKGTQLYAALRPDDLDKDFIFPISIARGIA